MTFTYPELGATRGDLPAGPVSHSLLADSARVVVGAAREEAFMTARTATGRRQLLPAALVAAALVLAGCGSGTPKDNGVASKSATDIVAAAKTAMKAKGTVHVVGTGSLAGSTMTFDARIRTKDDSGTGTLTVKGARLDLVRLGDKLYVKGDRAFFTAQGVPATLVSKVAGKWLVAAAGSGPLADLGTFFSLDELLKADGTLAKGARSTIHGHAVIEVKDSSQGNSGSLYVRTTGDPLVEQLTSAGTDKATLDFKEYGVKVDVQAPAGAVDLNSALG